MKKITRPMTPAEPVSAEDDIDSIRESQILGGDAISFQGEPLQPMHAGTFALLQRTRNGLIVGSIDNCIFDAAGFILLHLADEDSAKAARQAIFQNRWDEFVFSWLKENPNVHADLMDASGTIISMMEDFSRSLTKSASPQVPEGK